MLFEIILATLLGVTAGTFTGLIPGIHVNLISTLALTLGIKLAGIISPIQIAVFIIAMSVTHSFLDCIPSTFLGAPDPSKALMALPAHRLLLKGRAYEAIRLTVIGSTGSLVLAILLAPLMYFFLKTYDVIQNYMFFILLGTTVFMIFKDNRRWNNLKFYLLSGILGLVALNTTIIKNPLYPMLSGLFGTSILISSLADKVNIPIQTKKYEILKNKEKKSAIIGGFFAGAATSFMPGLGSSQGAALSQSFIKNISEKGFLIVIGGINTANFILSIITYYSISKARNGSIIAVSTIISEFTFIHILMFISVLLISAGISISLTLNISNLFSWVMQKVNYQVMIISVIIFVTAMLFLMTGPAEILLYFTSIALGYYAIKSGVAKNHLMGCLLLPITLHFM